MSDKNNLVKFLGVVTTVAGLIVSIASDWVTEQKMEKQIEEKVKEALAKQEDKKTES